MKRNKGIITILVGVGILFISIFFSSGYHPKLNFIGNISRMEIVLYEGKWEVVKPGHYKGKVAIPPQRRQLTLADFEKPGHYEGKVTIPLKYPLSLSVVFILLGTGIVLISKNKKTNA